MYNDPQSVTVNSVAKSMPRISTGDQKAIYRNADGSFTMTISHQKVGNGRIKSLVRIDQRKVVTDPVSAVTDYDTLTTMIIQERPDYGFSMVEVEQQWAAHVAWLTTGNVDKLYGGES